MLRAGGLPVAGGDADAANAQDEDSRWVVRSQWGDGTGGKRLNRCLTGVWCGSSMGASRSAGESKHL